MSNGGVSALFSRMTPFDASGAYRPTAEGSELRRLAVRSAAATVMAQGLALASQLISTVILARLLTPADFGVVTMATTLSLLLASFGLNGFTEAVIQFEEIDHFTASNLFWINSGAGLVLAVGFVAAGSLLGRFYRNPLVANVALGLSVGMFVAATSVIHMALLKRAMRFTVASVNDVVGRAANTAAAIILASMGWGYWALVAGIVVQQVSMTIGAWGFCRWIPSLPRRTGKTGDMVRFAANVYGRFAIRYTTQNVDNLLVGWHFDAVALGFYKRAYDLFALSASQFTAPLHNVALATLSRLNQDSVRLKRYLANSLGIIAFVGMAASGEFTLIGKDVVLLVLGPQWSESGRIFELFGPGIGAMLLCGTIGWIHLSIGQPGRWLRWTLVELASTVTLFVVALPRGPVGIAAAWSVAYWILLIPGFWYAGRPIGLGISSFSAIIWPYAAASLSAGFATAAIIRTTPFISGRSGAVAALNATMITSALFATLYLGVVIVLNRGCAPVRRIVSLLLELTPASRGAGLNTATKDG